MATERTSAAAQKLATSNTSAPNSRIATLGAGSPAYVFTPPTEVSGGAVGVLDYPLTFVLDRDAAKVFATEETYGGPIDFSQPRRKAHRLPCNSGAVFSINDTIAWYERVRAAMGGNVGDFMRLFEVPGMNHGGPATDKFDLLTALVDWVERGAAPERVVASAGTRRSGAQSGGTVDLVPERTRPLCAYPAVARYRGRGDVEDAASFDCVAP